MKMRRLLRAALVSVTLLAFGGCGGGGGGGGAGTPPGGTPPPPGGGQQVTVTLSTQGSLPAGTTIGGIDCTVQLPAGVTCRADATGLTDAGSVLASGSAQGGVLLGNFTAAAGGTPGQVKLAVIPNLNSATTAGFATGEFATLNLDFSGAAPSVGDFTISGLNVVDFTSGQVINGLTATVAVQIR